MEYLVIVKIPFRPWIVRIARYLFTHEVYIACSVKVVAAKMFVLQAVNPEGMNTDKEGVGDSDGGVEIEVVCADCISIELK